MISEDIGMAIGILTWKLHNFGTALQAYALVSYLNEHNDESCRLLNYTLPSRDAIVQVNPVTWKNQLNRIKNRISVEIKEKKNAPEYEKNQELITIQNKRFREFYKNIPNDSNVVSVANRDYFNLEYNKVIVGSDQVWNPKYFCETYFLDFVESSRRYSYAPSIGVSHLSKYEKQYLIEKLESFQRISVREKTGYTLLKELFPNRLITQVIDPTLLFSGEEWIRKLNINKKNIDELYIMVYTLSNNAWYKKAIEYIKNSLGIEKIIYVTSNDNLYFYKKENLSIDLGPKEFVELLYNATYIITDSFHGVCFSVNLKKNFTCFQRFDEKSRGENSRVYDFLKELELDSRIIKMRDRLNVTEVDYSKVDEQLDYLRESAKQYLNEVIGR